MISFVITQSWRPLLNGRGSLVINFKMAAGPSSKLEELEDRLESFIENLRVVGVIAGNFQQNGQGVLNERL